MQKKSGVPSVVALGVAALLALGGVAAAMDGADAQTRAEAVETAETVDDTPVSVAGMTVFIDPETGELRPPSAKEAAALSAAMMSLFDRGALAQPREIQLERGGVAIDVGLSQLDFSVATVGPEGVEYECLDSAHAAEDHIHSQAPTGEER